MKCPHPLPVIYYLDPHGEPARAVEWCSRLEKKFRWLGFVQGVLWSMGIQAIEASKRQNMPAGEEFKT